MPGLNRMDRPQPRRDQQQAEPRARRASDRAGERAFGSRRSASWGTRHGSPPREVPDVLRARSSFPSPGEPAPAMKLTSTRFVLRSSSSLSCQTGRIGIASTSAGRSSPSIDTPVAGRGSPAGWSPRWRRSWCPGLPAARRVPATAPPQMERIAGMLLDGRGRSRGTELDRPAVATDQEPLGVERAGDRRRSGRASRSGRRRASEPMSVRRSCVSVSSVRLTS